MQIKNTDSPVTRGEFHKAVEKLAAKEELHKAALAVVKMQSDLNDFERRSEARLTGEISRVLDAIDAFMRKPENYVRKTLLHTARIEDHETRISRLELAAVK